MSTVPYKLGKLHLPSSFSREEVIFSFNRYFQMLPSFILSESFVDIRKDVVGEISLAIVLEASWLMLLDILRNDFAACDYNKPDPFIDIGSN